MFSVEFLILGREWLQNVNYKLINTPELWEEEVMQKHRDNTLPLEISYDCETEGLNPFKHKIVGISMSWEEKQGIYVPIRHRYGNYPDPEQILRDIGVIFEERVLIAHNAKFDVNFLAQAGITIKNYVDTMWSVMANNSNEDSKGLKQVAKKYLNIEMIQLKEMFQGKRKDYNFAEVDPELGVPYACGDSDACLRIYNLFAEKRKEQEFITKLETKVTEVVRKMENRGVYLDNDFLSRLLEYIYRDLLKLEQDIYKEAGKHFTILSNKDLSEVLLEKGFKLDKSEKGNYVMNKASLDTFNSPLPKMIIKYRQLIKFFSTYIYKLWEQSESGERARFRFNQYAAATGRFSSGEDKDEDLQEKKKKSADADDGYTAINMQSIPSADKAFWFKAPQIIKRYDKETGELIFEDKPKVLPESLKEEIKRMVED